MSRDKQNKKNCVNCIHNLVCEKLEEFRDPLHWVNTEGEFVCSYYDTVYYDEASDVVEEIFAETHNMLVKVMRAVDDGLTKAILTDNEQAKLVHAGTKETLRCVILALAELKKKYAENKGE